MTWHLASLTAVLAALATPAAATAGDAELIARGKSVYAAQRCATCHAIGGAGNRRYPLDGVGARLSDEQLRAWIVAPRTMDPAVKKRAYDKLPTADVDALVAYLRSLTAP